MAASVDLIKATALLRFETALPPWLELRGIFRAMTAQPSAEIEGQPIIVTRDKEKLRLNLQVRAVVVDAENVDSPDDAVRKLTKVLSDIAATTEIPNIESVQLNLMFIESYPLPFHELVSAVKSAYYQPVDHIISASDISVAFDVESEQGIQNVQLGPMNPDQLRQAYLVFPRTNLPETFLFVSVSETTRNAGTYSKSAMLTLLTQSSIRATERAESVIAHITGQE